MDTVALIEKGVKEVLQDIYNLGSSDFVVEPAQNLVFGEYACNAAFQIARVVKRKPRDIAEELYTHLQKKKFEYKDASKQSSDIFSSIEVAGGGYINFRFSDPYLKIISRKIVEAGSTYGSSEEGAGVKIALEHSNVNPNKAAHVGHLRNLAIGQYLERVYEFMGYDVEVQYYSNDLGVQVATSFYGTELATHLAPDNYPKYDHYLWDVYAYVSAVVDRDPLVKKELEERIKSADTGEGDLFNRQVEFARKVLYENLRTFQELDVDYDLVVLESSIKKIGMWEVTFKKLKECDSFYFSNEGPSAGCWLIKMSQEGSRVDSNDAHEQDKIIVRSNGVPTYTGKDIAYHLWKYSLLDLDFTYEKLDTVTQDKPLRITTYRAHEKTSSRINDIVLNVIDVKQTYAIDVVRKSISSLGYKKQALRLHHINYGHVYLKNTLEHIKAAMSGRMGTGVKIDDLIRLMDEKLINEYGKTPNLSKVRNAAIKFEMLRYNTFQDVLFDLNTALDIKGYNGTYLQYTHARVSSILRKVVLEGTKSVNFEINISHVERSLIAYLERFPSFVTVSAHRYAPNILCEYLYSLCQIFNNFYANFRVLNEEDANTRNFRIMLCQSFQITLHNGLHLLGITPVEEI